MVSTKQQKILLNISNLTNLLSINFTYINGTSALTFDTANCNVSNELGTQYFNNTYSNGSVQGIYSLQLGNITTAAGAVSVPLTVSGFNNVGSVLLKIDYNASSLSFSSVTTTLSGVSFTAAASNGVLSISWFDQSGKTPIPITSGTLLTLNFTFNGLAVF